MASFRERYCSNVNNHTDRCCRLANENNKQRLLVTLAIGIDATMCCYSETYWNSSSKLTSLVDHS